MRPQHDTRTVFGLEAVCKMRVERQVSYAKPLRFVLRLAGLAERTWKTVSAGQSLRYFGNEFKECVETKERKTAGMK